MQVIAGALRGRKLKTPSGEQVRPTSGMVRGAMFNILGDRIRGVRVLDLYSGTGAIAIEALSRGASSAVLVEKSPDSQKLILDNLRALSLSDRAQLIRGDVLSKLATLTGPFEVVIADPPYRSLDWEALLQGLQQPGLLAPGAIVLFEHAKDEELPDTVGTIRRERVYQYGETQLSLFVSADAV